MEVLWEQNQYGMVLLLKIPDFAAQEEWQFRHGGTAWQAPQPVLDRIFSPFSLAIRPFFEYRDEMEVSTRLSNDQKIKVVPWWDFSQSKCLQAHQKSLFLQATAQIHLCNYRICAYIHLWTRTLADSCIIMCVCTVLYILYISRTCICPYNCTSYVCKWYAWCLFLWHWQGQRKLLQGQCPKRRREGRHRLAPKSWCFFWVIWVFPRIGRWFIMKNPIKMDDLGVPLFLETPIWDIHLIFSFSIFCWIWLQIGDMDMWHTSDVYPPLN